MQQAGQFCGCCWFNIIMNGDLETRVTSFLVTLKQVWVASLRLLMEAVVFLFLPLSLASRQTHTVTGAPLTAHTRNWKTKGLRGFLLVLSVIL